MNLVWQAPRLNNVPFSEEYLATYIGFMLTRHGISLCCPIAGEVPNSTRDDVPGVNLSAMNTCLD
jgi:hypothetical protein